MAYQDLQVREILWYADVLIREAPAPDDVIGATEVRGLERGSLFLFAPKASSAQGEAHSDLGVRAFVAT